MEVLLLVCVVLFVPGLIYILMIKERDRRHAFSDSFVDSPEFEVVQRGSSTAWPELRSKRGRPLTCGPGSTGGKHPILYWRIQASQVSLGQHTSLTLSREGMLGQLREAIGFSDVQVGDQDFDSTYTVRGSSPPHIRQVFADPAVRAATSELFQQRVLSCSLSRSGDLTVQIIRSDYGIAELHRAVEATRRFADALDVGAHYSAFDRPGPGHRSAGLNPTLLHLA
jgi:hypothetical protein